MSKLQGTVVADAIVPLGGNATHYDVFGQGGFRTVATLAERDTIALDSTLDADGLSSGLRKVNMLVAVVEDGKMYQLQVANFLTLSVSAKLSALANNTNWKEFAASDVKKAYVDAADQNLQGQVTTNSNSITSINTTLSTKADLVGGKVPVTQVPVATTTAVGGMKVGAGLVIQVDGTLSATVLSNYSEVTYAQLSALLATSGLNKGSYYVLTDFQTIQPITGTTAFSENGVTIPTFTSRNPAVNGAERLLLFALAANRIDAKARSMDFPQDELIYDVTRTTVRTFAVPGVILFRKDTANNLSTAYDFRKVRMRRYKVTGLGEVAMTLSGSTLTLTDATFGAASLTSSTTRLVKYTSTTESMSLTQVSVTGASAAVYTYPLVRVGSYNLPVNSFHLLTFNHQLQKFFLNTVTDQVNKLIGAYGGITNNLVIKSLKFQLNMNDYVDYLTFNLRTGSNPQYTYYKDVNIADYYATPNSPNIVFLNGSSVERLDINRAENVHVDVQYGSSDWKMSGARDYYNFGGGYGLIVTGGLFNVVDFDSVSGTFKGISNTAFYSSAFFTVTERCQDSVFGAGFGGAGTVRTMTNVLVMVEPRDNVFTDITNTLFAASVTGNTFTAPVSTVFSADFTTNTVASALPPHLSTVTNARNILFTVGSKSFAATYDATGKPTYTSLDGTVTFTPGTGSGSVQNALTPASTTLAPSVDAVNASFNTVNNSLTGKVDKPFNNQTFYGFNAGGANNLSAGGDGLTFIGSSAGNKNSTNNQTFVGVAAGLSTTTGANNTFIGCYAGQNNTTGQNNAVFGHFSGRLMTTGSQNLFIGSLAGQQTSGSYNTFMGFNAGALNTTGSSNIALGNASGPASGALSNTISIGDSAQATTSNTMFVTNSVNVGIGVQATASKLAANGVIESVLGGFKFPDGTTQTTAATGGGGITSASLSVAAQQLTLTTSAGNSTVTLPTPAALPSYYLPEAPEQYYLTGSATITTNKTIFPTFENNQAAQGSPYSASQTDPFSMVNAADKTLLNVVVGANYQVVMAVKIESVTGSPTGRFNMRMQEDPAGNMIPSPVTFPYTAGVSEWVQFTQLVRPKSTNIKWMINTNAIDTGAVVTYRYTLHIIKLA